MKGKQMKASETQKSAGSLIAKAIKNGFSVKVERWSSYTFVTLYKNYSKGMLYKSAMVNVTFACIRRNSVKVQSLMDFQDGKWSNGMFNANYAIEYMNR
jgi:hypothetical protein